jgi:mannosylglycerate hydrolase
LPASPLTFHLIPHTHWDREWYRSRSAFQARLVPVVDDLLDLLERDAACRFVLDGQTVLVEDYLAVCPDARDRVAAAVARRALETGPWYVLADELMPSGESLVRNLLLGSADAARLGRRMDVLYSPDAFGHPGVLPALAREFGLRWAVAWRGVPADVAARADLARWRAPDGREVLLYCLPSPGYEVGVELQRADRGLGDRWRPVRDALVGRASTSHVAVFVGADHHAAPTDLAGLRDRLQALEPGRVVRVSGLGEYFTAVEGSRDAGDLPVIAGELRHPGHTWILQGVHGTRARQKRRHSRAELLLSRVAEPLGALAAPHGGRDRRDLLCAAWRALLQSQFHDTLGGCAADDVAREQEVRLERVESLAREVAAASLADLTGHDPDRARDQPEAARPALVLWNPVARERAPILTAELSVFRRDVPVGPPSGRTPRTGPGWRPSGLVDVSGRVIPLQVLAVRAGHERRDATRHPPDQDEVDRVFVAFRAPPVPGLGVVTLSCRSGRRVPGRAGLSVRPGMLANRHVAVAITRAGAITLTDRRTGERYPALCSLLDEPDLGDTYTYSAAPATRRLPARRVSVAHPRVIARGPLIGAVELTGPNARLVVALDADSPVVRLRLVVDNRRAGHRLRARFPVGAGETAAAGAAFGLERRPPVVPDRTQRGGEDPVATAPAQRFVAAAAGTRGLALFAPGFFEYEWTRGRELVVTLFRAVSALSRNDLPERPGHAGWPAEVPLAEERGRHTIDLAVAPVDSRALDESWRLEHLWEDAFLPVQAAWYRDFTGTAGPAAGIVLEGDGLVLSAVKPPETGDGLVLRCRNARDQAVEGRIRFDRPLRSAAMIRADETRLDALPLDDGGRVVRFAVPARGLASLLCHPGRGEGSSAGGSG